MPQAAEAKKASFAEKLAAAEKDGIQRAESLALRDEVAEVIHSHSQMVVMLHDPPSSTAQQ